MIEPPLPTPLLKVVPADADADRGVGRWGFTLPHRYFLESSAGCSCEFRYWTLDFGFIPPQDWAGEDAEDETIEATRRLAAWLRQVADQGISTELIVSWSGDEFPEDGLVTVDLAAIDDNEFFLVTDAKMVIPASSSNQGQVCE